MNFKVGQKVVCVDNAPIHMGNPYNASLALLNPNNIYTVARLVDNDGIELNEIKSIHPSKSFHVSHFRPLDEIAQGVTMTFEKLQTVQPIYQS